MRGNGFSGVIAGAFVLGGAAGFLVGLLTAPASGERTRREVASRLRERSRQALRSGQQVVDQMATGLEHGIEAGRRKISGALAS